MGTDCGKTIANRSVYIFIVQNHKIIQTWPQFEDDLYLYIDKTECLKLKPCDVMILTSHFLSGNISTSPGYGVYISHFIRTVESVICTRTRTVSVERTYW